MYVCVCNAITEKQIVQAVDNGVRHLRELRSLLGIATECSRCARYAHTCLHGALAGQTRRGGTAHSGQSCASLGAS